MKKLFLRGRIHWKRHCDIFKTEVQDARVIIFDKINLIQNLDLYGMVTIFCALSSTQFYFGVRTGKKQELYPSCVYGTLLRTLRHSPHHY